MAHFYPFRLLLAASLFFTITGYAQSPFERWLEAECTDLGATSYVTDRDITASNGRHVSVPRGVELTAPGQVPDQFLRYDFTFDDPFVSELHFTLYAHLRTIAAAEEFVQIRLNGGEWTTFDLQLEVADTFAWYAAPATLTDLQAGTNILDVALTQIGAQLDKLYLTPGSGLPGGLGETATNCRAEDRNQAPIAIALATPGSGVAPLEVQLDGSQSFDDDGAVVDYAWAWDDGGSASGATPTVTFPTGTYTLTLTVTDELGATGTDQITVTADAARTGPQTDFWLEAECAAVGSQWTTAGSDTVSGGQAVVLLDQYSRATPPEDIPANRIRFTLQNAAAGDYSLFARIDAPSGASDSYWVRVDGGAWYSWSSGIRQGEGFQWNRYPTGPFSLPAGTHFIDFAYREAGTVLDKLHLNQTGKRPLDLGRVATNCRQATEADTRFVFEAECGQRGAGWQPASDFLASNEKYVLFLGPNALNEPTSVIPERSISFDFDVTTAATYYGFLRLDAPDPGSNSCWVRIDDGDWIEMSQEVGGLPLATDGFAWHPLADAGLPVSFPLTVGNHTVTIVNRESNTRLDKFYLAASPLSPGDLGPAASNCTTTIPPVVYFPSAPPPTWVSLADQELRVYPNPTPSALTITQSSPFRGPVTVRIFDATGRQFSPLTFDKTGHALQQTLDLSHLPAGLYHLQLLTDGQPQVRSFIKQ